MKAFTGLFFYLIIPISVLFAQEKDETPFQYDSIFYEYIPAEDNYDLIKDQLSCIENEIPLNYNNSVHAFVNHFSVKSRGFIKKILTRKDFYFPVFEKYLALYNLPDELKYLSIIESGLNPRAVSSARAVGLWQFMPYTGKSFGLHQDAYIDERMDFERATEAACKYLKQLHGMFGDWELAIAAYNTGPGNVRKAMRRSGKDKFWEIYPYLHRETRAYLPQFVAVMYVMNYLEEYNFVSTDKKYYVSYDTVMLNNYVHIPTLAKYLNLCEDDILNLNTGLRYNIFPDTKIMYPLRLPSQSIAMFQENRDWIVDSASIVEKDKMVAMAGNLSSSTYGRDKVVYRVQSGDVLGKIATRYHVKVSDLRAWNNLSGDMIRVGQRLDIWLKPGAYKPKTAVASAKPTVKAPQVTTENGDKLYIVQPGDTLWEISKKFQGLTIEKIKQLNSLNTDEIKPGQKLKIG
ncbi:MAG: LysM peptidoglycan-binding domain-containing protein [Cyclobacteriaceae bacterium]|nr:LysM peptidoglycan-binding domain-containing protein [Cyclobacteriaceae bacterium]